MTLRELFTVAFRLMFSNVLHQRRQDVAAISKDEIARKELMKEAEDIAGRVFESAVKLLKEKREI